MTTSVPTQVRAEGLTEQMGDLILQCSGSTPGAVIMGNFALSFPVSITNRIDSNHLTADAVLSVDYGLGFTPVPVNGLVNGNTISFNGVSLTAPASGNFNLKFSNIRAEMNQLGATASVPVVAGISVPLQINQAQAVVAYALTGLYATLYSSGISCTASPLPSSIDIADLFATKTALFSTRVTEGFGSAFLPQATGETNGTRFLVKYSGFPANARLFVPDLVAGSDTLMPTSGGDLGVPQAPGRYLSGSGTLLLARVQGADANGAGGTPVATPAGSNPVTLNAASEVTLSGGAGYVVYEVADSNPTLVESAQFPTFVGITSQAAAAVAQESVSFAPISMVSTASTSAPVPRFAATAPASDCGILGDCAASYFPQLSVLDLPVQLTAIAGQSSLYHGYVYVRNGGGGVMSWSATVNYTSGSGWLTLYTPTNLNSATIMLAASAQDLTPGTYQATVAVDAGQAGTAGVPVTFTVTPAPKVLPTGVTVSGIVNAATFDPTPLVPGSLATIKGSGLSGSNVSVTFDGTAAMLLYTSATQINLQVPAALGSKSTATVVVTVDGSSSAPQTVQLGPAWPSIFAHGVRNQDFSENAAATPQAAGNILQIFGTGIPAEATVAAQIGSASGLVPVYAGPAPGLTGVQQINVAVPMGLAAGSTQLTICASVSGQQFCSVPYPLFTD